jgi:diguanylate cyclase (GGDEF)-like protein
MVMKNGEELARLEGHIAGVEKRFRRIFFGASLLSVLILFLLALSVGRMAHLGILFVPLLAMLGWSVVVTAYAFYSLFIFAQQVKRELVEATFLDQTTGVYNRRYLERRLTAESERVRRYGGRTAILYMDLDHFKKVNDSHGHHVGNVVLHEVAQRMAKQLRACDALTRCGGDEFLVILPETTRDQAAVVAERLKKTVSDYVLDLKGHGRVDFVRISIGVAVFPEDSDDINVVVRAADRSVYKAKKLGGDSVCRVSETGMREVREAVAVETGRAASQPKTGKQDEDDADIQ